MTVQRPPETIWSPNEKRDVLLALATCPVPPLTETHPIPETLAAFSEGRLEPVDREQMLAHLAACDDCYGEWMAANDGLAAIDQIPAPAAPASVHRRRELPVQQITWRRRRRTLYGLGAALAASLVFIVLAPWHLSQDLSQRIQGVYLAAQMKAGSEVQEIASRDRLFSPSTSTNYGFSGGSSTQAARAFAAGLWEGRTSLSGNHPIATPLPPELAPSPGQAAESGAWYRTEWSDYTLLGRWVYLLQTLCKTAQPDVPGLWEGQHDIAVQIRERLARRPESDTKAKPVTTVVRSLETTLSQSPGLAIGRRCVQIQQDYDRLNALLTHTLPLSPGG